MSKKMRLWMAGTVGVLMAGFMSVSVYQCGTLATSMEINTRMNT